MAEWNAPIDELEEARINLLFSIRNAFDRAHDRVAAWNMDPPPLAPTQAIPLERPVLEPTPSRRARRRGKR